MLIRLTPTDTRGCTVNRLLRNMLNDAHRQVMREIAADQARAKHDKLCPKASVTLYDEEYHPERTCSTNSGETKP